MLSDTSVDSYREIGHDTTTKKGLGLVVALSLVPSDTLKESR